jgi:hypothetical protein
VSDSVPRHRPQGRPAVLCLRRRDRAVPHQTDDVQLSVPHLADRTCRRQRAHVCGDLTGAGDQLLLAERPQLGGARAVEVVAPKVRARPTHPRYGGVRLVRAPAPRRRNAWVSVDEPGRRRHVAVPPPHGHGRALQHGLDQRVRAQAAPHGVGDGQRWLLLGDRRRGRGAEELRIAAPAGVRGHDHPHHDQQHGRDRRTADQGRHLSVVLAFGTPQGRTRQSICQCAPPQRQGLHLKGHS